MLWGEKWDDEMLPRWLNRRINQTCAKCQKQWRSKLQVQEIALIFESKENWFVCIAYLARLKCIL